MIGIQGETALDEVTKSPADAALSTTSTNSVQNKVITKEINKINNNLTNLSNVAQLGNSAVGTSAVSITLSPNPSGYNRLYLIAQQGAYIRQVLTIPVNSFLTGSIFEHIQLAWNDNYINITRVDTTHISAISNLTDTHLYVQATK